jgi:hypothetical protein
VSGSATDGNADFGDEDVLATERGDSMWRLYVEYGRTNWWRGAVGVFGTVVARILGLVPAFILGLALDYCGFDEFEDTTVGLLAVAGGSFPVSALDHLRTVCRAVNAWVLPHQAAIRTSTTRLRVTR